MPAPAKTMDPQLRTIFDSIRQDFQSLREGRFPIRAILIHEATNASHYGVQPYPYESEVGYCGKVSAGMREGGVRLDANGMPLFADEAELDVHGQPITNSADEPFAVVVPAMRQVIFCGDPGAVGRLIRSSKRADSLIAQIRPPALDRLEEWKFEQAGGGLWWALLFEHAWAGIHPLLRADRYIWHSAGANSRVRVPYHRAKLERQLESSGFADIFAEVPREWMKRLPDAFASHLDDAATACCDFLEVLVGSSEPESTPTAGAGAAASSSFRRVGDCWQLQFVTEDGTVERPPPFKLMRGFELIRGLLYAPEALLCEFPEAEPPMPRTDKKTLASVRAEIELLKARLATASIAEREDLEAQIRAGEDYLRTTTRPGGHIRTETTDLDRARSRFRNAVNDALAYAADFAPKWVTHMRHFIVFKGERVPVYRPSPSLLWVDIPA